MPAPQNLFVTAPDGLSLHVRAYGRRIRDLPIVCLPGLTRTEADFETLATRFATDRQSCPTRLCARLSWPRPLEYDRDWHHYDPLVELGDLIAVTTALGLERAIFVGTSRGGILTMLLAAVRPSLIAGAVLNDIGPVIEMKGLLRIKGYVGKTPRPRNYADGVTVLRRFVRRAVSKTHRCAMAGLGQAELGGGRRTGLSLRYDEELANTLQSVNPETPCRRRYGRSSTRCRPFR